MFFKLRTVLIFFLLLNLVIFTGKDLQAQIKDYGEALSDILRVHPLANDIEEAKEKYGQPEKPDVEFGLKKDPLALVTLPGVDKAITAPYIAWNRPLNTRV